MMRPKIQTGGSNALGEGRTLEMRAETTARASAESVYATLADLSSHLEWAGSRRPKNARLLTIEPASPAGVGAEFRSTGADPMGSFADDSVVTEAIPGRVFEFVTEAKLTPKRGGEPVGWTLVHRYEIARDGNASRIVYTARITRISRLPGMLKLFRSPFAGLVTRMAASGMRKTVENLAQVAEGRSA